MINTHRVHGGTAFFGSAEIIIAPPPKSNSVVLLRDAVSPLADVHGALQLTSTGRGAARSGLTLKLRHEHDCFSSVTSFLKNT